ncbi:MAG: EAL domain-containing protein [Actinomycetia bacterium]|nr:EAL domain-containing protein [Actinomycetes bacterium]
MLTSKGQEADRVAGLSAGADDYVVKPFFPSEVSARISAVGRRSRSHILASHDPLTNLANRRELNDRLAGVVSQYDGGGGAAAVLYIDLNQFKLVNDTYGHDTGDELIVAVANRLRSAVRSGTLVCRVGGDEFVVVLEDVQSASAAVATGNRILEQVQAESVPCRNATLIPSLSMGVSFLGDNAQTPEELLSQADLAMFEAKRNRLKECVFYTDLIGSGHKKNARLRAKMSDSIKRSEFRMAYQPIMNAATGAVFGIEGFIRWRVGDEEVPAGEIIRLAEDSKQIGVLSTWILRRSFKDYAALGRNDLKLHVNMSADQVFEPGFLKELLSACRESRIDPASVCLELGERGFSRDPNLAYTALRRVRDSGFSLAIDDFGVEYASMTNLLNAPVNWLKIDSSFVAEVHKNERVQRLVRGQIAVAASMQINLIAAGIENEEQADWLREAGCVLQQGFFYARPIETEDLASRVREWSAA